MLAKSKSADMCEDFRGREREKNNVPDGACEGWGNGRDGEEQHGEEGGAHCVNGNWLKIEYSGCKYVSTGRWSG